MGYTYSCEKHRHTNDAGGQEGCSIAIHAELLEDRRGVVKNSVYTGPLLFYGQLVY